MCLEQSNRNRRRTCWPKSTFLLSLLTRSQPIQLAKTYPRAQGTSLHQEWGTVSMTLGLKCRLQVKNAGSQKRISKSPRQRPRFPCSNQMNLFGPPTSSQHSKSCATVRDGTAITVIASAPQKTLEIFKSTQPDNENRAFEWEALPCLVRHHPKLPSCSET